MGEVLKVFFMQVCAYQAFGIPFFFFFLQKKQLFADLNELSEEIQGVLKNHLSMFNIKSPSDVTKIEERVK